MQPDNNAWVIQDLYMDEFALVINSFGIIMTGLRTHPMGNLPGTPNAANPPTPVAILRMSPELAKALALVLHTQLKRYEREAGVIPISNAQLVMLDVAREDW